MNACDVYLLCNGMVGVCLVCKRLLFIIAPNLIFRIKRNVEEVYNKINKLYEKKINNFFLHTKHYIHLFYNCLSLI